MCDMKSFSRSRSRHGSMNDPSKSCAPHKRKKSISKSPFPERKDSSSWSDSSSSDDSSRPLVKERHYCSSSEDSDDYSSPSDSEEDSDYSSSSDDSDDSSSPSDDSSSPSDSSDSFSSSDSDDSSSSDSDDSRSSSPRKVDEEWGVMKELLPIDWKETATKFVFKADVPGLEKKDVSVRIKDKKLLCLRGERKKLDTKNQHSERKTGKFVRRFRLPHNVNVGATTAVLKRRVLIVTLPKQAREVIDIPVSD
ncbi:hypothetical protein COLO4_15103 [Corchorus olitorius]|uniref:SHSP domain-containing protein n=1 Tax=Corchorus olitorius TaxID=93759 RepID=A0A1R3JPQ7_9ROSI|nr:hypothetical protein COLO4_15103 [Corchorus olitorius]